MTRKLGFDPALAAAALISVAVLAMPMTALGHHSYAMFDRTKEVVLKDAMVVKWDWTSPHTWLYVDVPNGTAVPDHYAVEGGNPGILRRLGYGIGTFKPGDKVTVYVAPLKDVGVKGGSLQAVVLPNGKMLGERLQDVQAGTN